MLWRPVMRVRLETCRCTDGGAIYRWKNLTWTYEQWRGPDVGVLSLSRCTLPLRLVMEARQVHSWKCRGRLRWH